METEPFESILVKTEPEFQSLIQETSLVEEENESETTSDEEYDQYLEESSSDRNEANISCIHFTCANCKKNYDDFNALTKHITSRVSQVETFSSHQPLKQLPPSSLIFPGLQHNPQVQKMPESLRQLGRLQVAPENPPTKAKPPKQDDAVSQVFTMPASLQLRGRSQKSHEIACYRRQNWFHLPLHSMPRGLRFSPGSPRPHAQGTPERQTKTR
jgi:hypothetical protein